jgi:subtilisin-like proprotein convertase family protein
MKKLLLLLVLSLSFFTSFSQKQKIWEMIDPSSAIDNSQKIRTTTYSENQKLFVFDKMAFNQLLTNVKDINSGEAGVVIELPNINGDLESFLIWESSNFEPALQNQFPQIRAYVGRGITDPYARLNFSFDPKGIQTMVFRPDNGTEFIEPYTKDNGVYVLFDSKTRVKGHLPFTCKTADVEVTSGISNRLGNQILADNQQYKTIRLALSCTGEYGLYHGGTEAGALAAMNATMTRCNGVFEKDLAIKLLIIANNVNVIHLDPDGDPYSPSAQMNNWNDELQAHLDAVIGNAGYDIGHLFGATGGGGSAGCIGCVCEAGIKGSGITSPVDGIPQGDNFDIDYVAHEMGHQMGANHTFTHTSENNTVNVEPGSGTTIMAYAGLGGPGIDIQNNSDDYFTYRSILQIQTDMLPRTCPVTRTPNTNPAFTNTAPVANAGPNYTIPRSTAFKLVGIGTGTAGENLTYSWEQNDDATTVGATASLPSPTKTNGPNFRSRVPSSSPIRFMPPLANVLNGQLTTTWETVSSVGRNLNFSFTVRDNVLNGGQTDTDTAGITVSNTTGPFTVTSQNNIGINWEPGSTQTITWNVNNANTHPGAANVNIKLSTDGGLNFDTVLASNTLNDGTETITVPNITALNCRIIVEPTANVFYAVNSRPFSIGYTCYTYTATPNSAISDGVGNNQAGTALTSVINVPATITVSNPRVLVNITHPRIGDLILRLTHPDGTIRTLWSRNCNSSTFSSGMNVLFGDGQGTVVCASPTSGSYNSFQLLSGFNNKPSNGNWTLTVIDNNINNTGTLVSWTLDLGCQLLSTQTNTIEDLVVYPNPNKGQFTIQFSNPVSPKTQVTVYDISGRKIFENSYDNQSLFNESITLQNAQAGVYLLNIVDGNRKEVKRLIIE